MGTLKIGAGDKTQVVKCLNCERNSKTRSYEFPIKPNFGFPAPKDKKLKFTLEEMLEGYLIRETLNLANKNQYHCENCQKNVGKPKQDAQKYNCYTKVEVGNVVYIQLMRFSFITDGTWDGTKLENDVEIPTQLEFKLAGEEKTKLRLKSAIRHSGSVNG